MQNSLQAMFGPIRQVAYIVTDIRQAIADWHMQMGIGPFALANHVKPLEGSRYRGQPSNGIELHLAFAYMDGVQLELIQPVNDTPSLYQEAIARGPHSLHHYGFCVDDYDKAFAHAMDAGFEAIVEAGQAGYARMSYVESKLILGLICELIEWNDNTRPYFDGVQQFLANADQNELVHPMAI